MSNLASRCPACQTVFRVVPDQLRVSAGWVRCGRCAEVFNAAEHLVDATTGQARPPTRGSGLDFDLPGDAPTSSFVPPPHMNAPPEPDGPQDIRHGEFIVDPYAPVRGTGSGSPEQPPRDGRDAGSPREPRRHENLVDPTEAYDPVSNFMSLAGLPGTGERPSTTPAPALSPATEPASHRDAAGPGGEPAPATQAPVAAGPPQAADEPTAPPSSAGSGAEAETEAPPSTTQQAGSAASAPAELPSFIVEADKAARWRRPWVRAGLAVGAGLAGLVLAAQVLYGWRDRMAAQSPVLRPLLVWGCEAFACRIAPPRALEALRVEASGLVRVDRSDLYRLSVTLRNPLDYDVALPALELALTDTAGQLIARRVLRPSELGASVAALGGGTELVLQSTLQVAAAPVAGYTIELFYP